jgi:hypothetical protein
MRAERNCNNANYSSNGIYPPRETARQPLREPFPPSSVNGSRCYPYPPEVSRCFNEPHQGPPVEMNNQPRVANERPFNPPHLQWPSQFYYVPMYWSPRAIPTPIQVPYCLPLQNMYNPAYNTTLSGAATYGAPMLPAAQLSKSGGTSNPPISQDKNPLATTASNPAVALGAAPEHSKPPVNDVIGVAHTSAKGNEKADVSSKYLQESPALTQNR